MPKKSSTNHRASPTSNERMYDYYERQSVLPTFANLKDARDLAEYAQARNRFFTDKLHLPPAVFHGADVVEFGPDTGENAMVFAQWGARMDLVEPNKAAWPKIKKYFETFGLASNLISLVESDVEKYSREDPCDIIDAEGFIYSIQPSAVWLDAFNRILKSEGYFIISYYERLGGFLELCLKAVCTQYCYMTDLDSSKAVRHLFQNKWDSIPHTRSMDSWIMDVFDNPFVRLKYFLDAPGLYRDAREAGFSLYSSWPKYKAPLEFDWHKRLIDPDLRWRRDEEHLLRSALSFFTGRKMYLTTPDPETLETVYGLLNSLIEAVDTMIDDPAGKARAECINGLEEIRAIIQNEALLLDQESDRGETLELLSSVRRMFEMAEAGDADGLRDIANTDSAFIGGWGLPYHFAVFQNQY